MRGLHSILGTFAVLVVVGVLASPSIARTNNYHYIGPNGATTCTNVSFPQHNWFNSQYGMLNKVDATYGQFLLNAGGTFYVGYVRNGQVDVVVKGNSQAVNMHVGGPSLSPWTDGSEAPYYRVDSYVLYEGECPGTKPIPQPQGCPDYLVIDSRGSGRPVGEISPSGTAFIKEFKLFHLDAAIEVISNPYPAGGGAFGVAGAKLKIPRLGAYHDSVVLGKRWLRSKISAYLNICESTKIFLVGYSQGAQVTADVVQEPKASEWTNVQGVVLFGDPSYNPSGSSNRYGLNEPDVKKRHTAQRGALHMRTAFNDPKVLSFCHRSDPACQDHGIRMSQHKNYTSFNEPEEAAKYFAEPVAAVSDGSKPSSATVDKWPTKRNDGSTVFSMWLGANLFIMPDWSSCDPNYCIVGSSNTVYAISMADGFDQIGNGIPIGATSPRAELGKLGIPEQDIQKLLAP